MAKSDLDFANSFVNFFIIRIVQIKSVELYDKFMQPELECCTLHFREF